MADWEKVIYSLERCSCMVPDACRDCAYDHLPARECVTQLKKDALKLLKAPLSEQDRADLDVIHRIRSGEFKKAVCREYVIYNGDWYRAHPWNVPKENEPIEPYELEK